MRGEEFQNPNPTAAADHLHSRFPYSNTHFASKRNPSRFPNRSSQQNGGIGSSAHPRQAWPGSNQRRQVPEYLRRFHENTTAIFFSNFPEGWYPSEMRTTFQKFGEVKEVFVPSKRDKKGHRFGFVRFKGQGETKRLLQAMNQTQNGAFKLKANIPRFERGYSGNNHITKPNTVDNNRKGFVNDRSYAEATGYQHPVPSVKLPTEKSIGIELSFKTTPEDSAWLEGCIVGTLLSQEDRFKAQQDLFLNGFGNSRIISLGGLMVLICDDNKEILSELLKEDNRWTELWFMDLKLWNKSISAPSREVWINCLGIPAHAWSFRFFEWIASSLGNLIRISKETFDREQLDCGRILISTSSLQFINEMIKVEIDGTVFHIRLLEDMVNQSSDILKVSYQTYRGQFKGQEDPLESVASDSDSSNEFIPNSITSEQESKGDCSQIKEPGDTCIEDEEIFCQDDDSVAAGVEEIIETPNLDVQYCDSANDIGLQEFSIDNSELKTIRTQSLAEKVNVKITYEDKEGAEIIHSVSKEKEIIEETSATATIECAVEAPKIVDPKEIVLIKPNQFAISIQGDDNKENSRTISDHRKSPLEQESADKKTKWNFKYSRRNKIQEFNNPSKSYEAGSNSNSGSYKSKVRDFIWEAAELWNIGRKIGIVGKGNDKEIIQRMIAMEERDLRARDKN